MTIKIFSFSASLCFLAIMINACAGGGGTGSDSNQAALQPSSNTGSEASTETQPNMADFEKHLQATNLNEEQLNAILNSTSERLKKDGYTSANTNYYLTSLLAGAMEGIDSASFTDDSDRLEALELVTGAAIKMFGELAEETSRSTSLNRSKFFNLKDKETILKNLLKDAVLNLDKVGLSDESLEKGLGAMVSGAVSNLEYAKFSNLPNAVSEVINAVTEGIFELEKSGKPINKHLAVLQLSTAATSALTNSDNLLPEIERIIQENFESKLSVEIQGDPKLVESLQTFFSAGIEESQTCSSATRTKAANRTFQTQSQNFDSGQPTSPSIAIGSSFTNDRIQEFTLAADKTIYAYFKDELGNVSDIASVTAGNTNTGPVNPSISFITTVDGFLKQEELSGNVIQLSATDDDILSPVVGYYLSENSTVPLANASGWETVPSTSNYSEVVSFSFSAGSGEKTIYAYFKDTLGNISASASENITLDREPPNNVEISGPTITNSKDVMLSISATDDTGVVAYAVTESADTPTSWKEINPPTDNFSLINVSHIVSAQGDKTIYVHFEDNVGQISSSSHNIKFEAPSVEVGSDGVEFGVVGFGDAVVVLDPNNGIISEPDANGAITITQQVTSSDNKTVTTAAVLNADGSGTNTVTIGGVTTTVKAPAGSTLSFDGATGAITATKTTSSGSTLSLVINGDGTLDNQLTVGSTSTLVKLPAGSTANPKDSGAVVNTSTVTFGSDNVSVTTSVDSGGDTEVEFTDSDNATIILPSPAGSTTTISGSKITTSINLSDVGAQNARFVAADTPAQTVFVGRLDGTQVLVTPLFNAAVTITNSGQPTSKVELTTGQALINGAPMAQAPYSVFNYAVPVSVGTGSNFVSSSTQNSISASKMELKFADVHSVWTWDSSVGKWSAYSAENSTQTALNNDPAFGSLTSVDYASGMLIYNKDNSSKTLNLADSKDVNLAAELSKTTLSRGWHFRSNGNQNNTVSDVLDANSAIQSIWVRDVNSWKVYAPNAHLRTQIADRSYTLMSATDTLATKGTVWIYVDPVFTNSGSQTLTCQYATLPNAPSIPTGIEMF
jgi:hypothetical protein